MAIKDWVYCNRPMDQSDFVVENGQMTMLANDRAEQVRVKKMIVEMEADEAKVEKMIKEMKTYHSW